MSSAEESEDRRARVPATEAVQVECNPVTSVRVMSTYPIDDGDGARYAVVAGLTYAYLEIVVEQVEFVIDLLEVRRGACVECLDRADEAM